MTTKFILHGGFTRVDNELNKSFFSELIKDISEEGNVLMCFFAAEEDKGDVFLELSKKIKQQNSANNISFTLADRDTFINQVQIADVIYFHGGHTRILLNELSKYDNLKDLFADKTVAGSSAGAYALATYGTAHDEEHTREGLGILPIRIVCHFQSEKLPPTETSLAELEDISPELEMVILRDCEWKIVTKKVPTSSQTAN